jgi:hypothetical protein
MICGRAWLSIHTENGKDFGYTPAEARAGAWITAWWPECDLRAVPRVVPEGWTFEIYAPGKGPVFRRI